MALDLSFAMQFATQVPSSIPVWAQRVMAATSLAQEQAQADAQAGD